MTAQSKAWRILLVDDDAEYAAYIRAAGQRLGHAVTWFQAPEDAQAAIAAAPDAWEVAVIDLQLPGSNGLELAAAIRKNYPHLRCAVITGSDSPEDNQRSSTTAGIPVLPKPFDLNGVALLFTSAAAAPAA